MSLDNVDMGVVNTAYSTARQMGADDRTTLALFEAGLVESGFRNLTTPTDHDSLGYLQQRPSQGWVNPTDVATATKSFLARAMANARAHPEYTAGQLAQSVQVSAYPDRYDQRADDAKTLLGRVAGAGGAGANPPGEPTKADGLVDAVLQAAGALNTMATGAVSTGALATQLLKLALPSNIMRMFMGGAGIAFIFFGIVILGKEVKNA